MGPKIEEKPETYADRERTLLQKWQNEGRALIHQCAEWDYMLICETSPEILACCCDFANKSDSDLLKFIQTHPDSALRMSSIPAAIGEEQDVTDKTAEIHSPDFSAQAARPRLGNEMEVAPTASKPFVFPVIKERMTLSDAMTYLIATQAIKGCLIFWPEGHDEPTFVNFGDLSRAEMVYALERTKHEELLTSFTSDDEEDV